MVAGHLPSAAYPYFQDVHVAGGRTSQITYQMTDTGGKIRDRSEVSGYRGGYLGHNTFPGNDLVLHSSIAAVELLRADRRCDGALNCQGPM